MFISGGPSSQTHFPYQADLCGNISPPDPLLSLPARRVNRPATALRQPPPSSGASRSMSPTRPLPPSLLFSRARTSSAHPFFFFSSVEVTATSAPSLLFSTVPSTKPGRCCSTLPLPGTPPHPTAILSADA
jgi:hypothetical protein